jgi:hypothetical protein
MGAEAWLELSFAGLILPERMPPHTGTEGSSDAANRSGVVLNEQQFVGSRIACTALVGSA